MVKCAIEMFQVKCVKSEGFYVSTPLPVHHNAFIKSVLPKKA